MTLDEVIARLEAGETGRQLDAAIWWHAERPKAEGAYWAAALGLPRPLKKMPVDSGLGWANMRVCSPRYTTSLDAALTLAPEGWSVLTAFGPAGAIVNLSLRPLGTVDGQAWTDGARADTPALALCIAALRARRQP